LLHGELTKGDRDEAFEGGGEEVGVNKKAIEQKEKGEVKGLSSVWTCDAHPKGTPD